MRRSLIFWLAPVLLLAQRPGYRTAGGNGDRLIETYQKQASREPSNLRVQNLLASAYLQKVRESQDFSYLDRASKIVEAVLDADAGNYVAMRLRSEIELERHSFAQVAEYSEELIKLAPEDPWNWGTLGDALMELGRYDRAGEAYAKMAALQPGQASYNRLAYHRFTTGNPGGAIEMMRLAVSAGGPAPENTAWCLVDLGGMYFRTGRLDEAEGAYKTALGLLDGYHSAYAGLGRVAAARGAIAEAIAFYKRAQASIPLPDYAAALVALYQAEKKPEEAARQLALVDVVDRLAQANGEKTNRNLAVIYADQGRKLDRALELVQEELKVRQDVYTYDALAWVLYKQKRYREAREASELAVRMKTPDPGIWYHAGMIALALERTDEAKGFLKQAQALNPKFDFLQAPVAAKTLASLPSS